MTDSTRFNIVRYSTPTPGSTQEEHTQAQEQQPPTPLNNNEVYNTDNTASTAQRQSDIYKATLYGSGPVQALGGRYTLNEREGLIDAYATRVSTQIKNIESGSEGERNVKFQNVRLFMEPSGYFSAGLLAAGFDPQEKITVTFNTYVGMGTAENLSGTESRTYSAWEIAAGILEHDTPERGGIVNFHGVVIDKKDQSKINDLQSFGKQLQKHWEQDIATPMRGSAKVNSAVEILQDLPFLPTFVYKPKISTVIPERSGKADAYVARGALQSLRHDKDAFEKLSPAGQEAISRTLDKNGQVIIPNIYGYPLSGYAFVPYTPYDGNAKHRPNQGVMVDLRSGAVREIKGDDEFATWAKDNRNQLISRFNASDLQGGKDAHWPPAAAVLDRLIQDNSSHFPGRNSLITDKSVPVRELFNYTESRGSDYELKVGDLNKGIASHYQEVNAKNALWDDQTKVFGAVEQGWKGAKEVWGNTFGYVPVLGNAGNIVFGRHDAEHGMTASDRVAGTAGAVISGLLLAHEIIPAGVEAGLGDAPLNFNASGTEHYNWQYNAQTSEFELARIPKSTSNTDAPSVTPNQAPQVVSAPQAASFPGMREIELKGTTYFAAEKPDTPDGLHYLLRVRDPNDPSKLASSGIVARPDEAGKWTRENRVGGRWPWDRAPSPTPSNDVKTPPKISNGFEILGDPKISGADKFDEILKSDSTTHYEQSINNVEEQGVIKRKLTVTSTTEERVFKVKASERAQPNEYSSTDYSPNFLKDLNRDHYTVQIKQPDGSYTTIELDTTGSAHGETLNKRLKQLEEAIPDPALRTRISEVAHQASVAPASVELKLNQLQDHIGFRGTDTHYTIMYDPAANQAQVKFEAKMTLLDLDKDAAQIPNVEVSAKRTFHIGESNELLEDGNPYIIDKNAPFTLSTAVTADLK